MSTLVSTCSLTKTYWPSKTAVDNVTLEVSEGEFFCIVGPSGCGKTTLLSLLGGFLYPTSGKVFIDGVEMTKVPPERRPTNTVFQELALFPHLTVGNNIRFGMNAKGVGKQEVDQRTAEIIDLLKLNGLENRKPRQLSGGEQQRVALARAIVNRPKVLLLDEPLGAIDAVLARQLLKEFESLQKHLGITFIFVTHDQADAFEVSDRIAVMNDARIVQIGKPQSIYEQPATPFVASFVGESNRLTGKVSELRDNLARVALGGNQAYWAMAMDGTAVGTAVDSFVRPENVAITANSDSTPLAGLSGACNDFCVSPAGNVIC